MDLIESIKICHRNLEKQIFQLVIQKQKNV